MTENETGYLEDCCWAFTRQHCKGQGCACRCHVVESGIEAAALGKTAALIADDYRDDTKGGEWTPEIQSAVRKAWLAGRDFGRRR